MLSTLLLISKLFIEAPDSVEVGPVWLGESKRFLLQLKNNTDHNESLILRPCCGCVQYSGLPEVMKPGQVNNVDCSFSSLAVGIGKFTRNIAIYDGNINVKNTAITGEVKPLYDIGNVIRLRKTGPDQWSFSNIVSSAEAGSKIKSVLAGEGLVAKLIGNQISLEVKKPTFRTSYLTIHNEKYPSITLPVLIDEPFDFIIQERPKKTGGQFKSSVFSRLPEGAKITAITVNGVQANLNFDRGLMEFRVLLTAEQIASGVLSVSIETDSKLIPVYKTEIPL
jgi:hypothetical protein